MKPIILYKVMVYFAAHCPLLKAAYPGEFAEEAEKADQSALELQNPELRSERNDLRSRYSLAQFERELAEEPENPYIGRSFNRGDIMYAQAVRIEGKIATIRASRTDSLLPGYWAFEVPVENIALFQHKNIKGESESWEFTIRE